MRRSLMKRMNQAWFAPLLFMLVLSACSTVTLISPYDEKIESGVTGYAENLSSFLVKMQAANGTPAGKYENNIDFYATQTGVLDGLILRAEAQDTGVGCLLTGKAIKILGDKLPSALRPKPGQTTGTPEGCSVMMVKNIKEQLGIIANIQKSMGGLNADVVKSVQDISMQAIRAVLTVEMLKKKGE